MKKLILFLVCFALAAPAFGITVKKLQRTGKIETDEHGGYSEQQSDYKARRVKQTKSSGGYYGGTYHSSSSEFQPADDQFVDKSSSGGSSKKTKSYKKVEEKKSTK